MSIFTRSIFLVALFAVLVITAPLAVAIYDRSTQGVWPSWSGFGQKQGPTLQPNEEFQPSKTYWDLLELLIIPVFLAVGGFVLAQSARQSEIQIAENRSQDLLLHDFYRDIHDFVINKDVEMNENVQNLIRAQTLAVLRALNGERKGMVLLFLQESKLIQRYNPLIPLENADLQNTILRGADLSNCNLSGCNLSGADLKGSDLSKTDLTNSILVKANLSPISQHITLRWGTQNISQFVHTTSLAQANLTSADLRGADLRGAVLTEAQLSGAILKGTDFRGFGLFSHLTSKPKMSIYIETGPDDDFLAYALSQGAILTKTQREQAKKPMINQNTSDEPL